MAEKVDQQEEQLEETTVIEEATEAEQKETEDTVAELDAEAQKIADFEKQLAEQEDRYLRLRADYDNLLRRQKIEREAAEKYRAQSLLTDLVPVLDNLARALQVEVTSEEAKSLYTGVEMVYRQFVEATEKEGLEAIPSEGEPFDPNFHQAVMQEQDSEQPSGTVLRELQKGFKLKDRVLRPSMVSVNE